MCLPCHSILVGVRQLDPQATQSWQRYMDNQQRKSIRTYMESAKSSPIEMAKVDREYSEKKAAVERERLQTINNIWVTSGFNFEGNAITSYRGFISEETAVGMGFFKGFASSVSNLTGTESESLRNKLRQSKQIVMQRLREDAYEAGANAIIGLDLDYTMFGDSIVGVIVSGTAVTIVPNRPVA